MISTNAVFTKTYTLKNGNFFFFNGAEKVRLFCARTEAEEGVIEQLRETEE